MSILMESIVGRECDWLIWRFKDRSAGTSPRSAKAVEDCRCLTGLLLKLSKQRERRSPAQIYAVFYPRVSRVKMISRHHRSSLPPRIERRRVTNTACSIPKANNRVSITPADVPSTLLRLINFVDATSRQCCHLSFFHAWERVIQNPTLCCIHRRSGLQQDRPAMIHGFPFML
jgi:hypothetical protein